MSQPLWTPSPERIAQSNLTRFMATVNREHGLTLDGYDALYDWSIADIPAFWEALWRFLDIKHSAPYASVLEDPRMPGATWFKGARLNFAENLLRYRDDRPALVSIKEDGEVAAQVTYAELFAQVARMASFLRENGVTAGDRVAGYLPNCVETVVAMLAAASLGAVWSSCSPDFGFKSVLERFGQIEPKVLIAADGYRYHGRSYDTLPRVAEVVQGIESIARVVIVPFVSEAPDISRVPRSLPWAEALNNPAETIDFAQLAFDHPFTSCTPQALPAFPSASCTAPAARSSSTPRSTSCRPT